MDLWHLTFWLWWGFAVVLLGLAVWVSRALLFWMGLAGVVVGGVLYFVPSLGWQYQFMLFAIFTIVMTAIWKLFSVKHSA